MNQAIKKTYFRSDVSRGIVRGLGVDRNKEVIHGFSVISLGIAKGHDMEIDGTALDQVVTLGNKRKHGIKARFGHPNMSSEALGTFLGRSRNFKRHGNVVRADLHLDKSSHETPTGDLAAYVMSLAESDPESFGASIVFSGETELRVDEDGSPLLDDVGNELLPLARVNSLNAADIVDEPAANENGFFGHKFFNEDVKLSAEATAFLRKFLGMPDSVEKVIKFLTRYSSNESNEREGEKMSEQIVCSVKLGESLARVLNTAIDAKAEREDSDRASIIAEMADAAGIEPTTVNQILEGSINCPPRERLEGFARVLGLTMQTLIRAGNEDGCEYETQQSTKQGGEKLSKELGAEVKVSYKDGYSDGLKAGADAERKRIQDVEAQCLPGHEDLIETLKFDGKTSGAEAAVKVLSAEKSLQAKTAEDLLKDAGKSVDFAESGDKETGETTEAKGDRLIQEYMEANKCDYREALLAVSSKHKLV